MKFELKKNPRIKQSEKFVNPNWNSSDKYDSSFHRPKLITRTIHSKKNGLTWL